LYFDPFVGLIIKDKVHVSMTQSPDERITITCLMMLNTSLL
jgi:hypothetical protein